MALWGAALGLESNAGRPWRVVAPSPTLVEGAVPVEVDASLNLASSIRAYRNSRFGEWVDSLLSGDIGSAQTLAGAMVNAPAFVVRDLQAMKEWLSLRRRGGRRPGIVVSSGAARSLADGLPPAPLSNELKVIENWFLKSWPDFRGSDSLEVPMSEFGCQGLELDYVGLCWGGDLVWSPQLGQWLPRKMRAPAWQAVRRPEGVQHRLNAYRVLLTRAREGLCIFVPRGSANDPTRLPTELDEIAKVLKAAGCVAVGR